MRKHYLVIILYVISFICGVSLTVKIRLKYKRDIIKAIKNVEVMQNVLTTHLKILCCYLFFIAFVNSMELNVGLIIKKKKKIFAFIYLKVI